YFFNMLGFRDLLNPAAWRLRALGFNLEAVAALAALLVVAVTLSAGGILLPLRVVARPARGVGGPGLAAAFAAYFAAIGFAYIFVEIGQLQSLTLFLGHPTFSLGVVLPTLLISSGLGSWLTGRVSAESLARSAPPRFVLLGVLLALVAAFAPEI